MIFHLFATAFIFMFSTRFNKRGVIVGSDEGIDYIPCHYGWEWYPKHFGLIVYTFVIGPILVHMLRKVEDTHYMKQEIIMTILASWICFPLFIVLYTYPVFRSFNEVFPPLLWFNVALMGICIICFVFPLMEINSLSKMRLLEDKKNRNIFINISDAKVSREFAEILSNPTEFSKFAAFTVKDLSTENALFFEKAVGWRAKACYLYNVDPKTNKKLINKPSDDAESTFLLTKDDDPLSSSVTTHAPPLSLMTATAPFFKSPHPFATTSPNTIFSHQVMPLFSSKIPYNEVFLDDHGKPIAKVPYLPTFNDSGTCIAQPFQQPHHLESKEDIIIECAGIIREFINADAALSINILSSTRKKILDTFDYVRDFLIVFVFDEAISEVIELMYRNTYIKYILAKKKKGNHKIHLFDVKDRK